MRASLLLTLLLSLSLPAWADEQVLRFYGYAYDLKSNRYLYTEVHQQHLSDGRWVGGTMTYYDPQGRRIGFKTLDFARDPAIPLYHLTLDLTGYEEGIDGIGDTLSLFKRHARGEPLERASVARGDATAADSGFHAYIRQHFAELMAGQTLNFRLVAAGNLDAYKFRIRRIDDTRFEDAPAVRLKVEPDSLLRFVVDPLELTYDPQSRKLLEYRGISNIHDSSGNPYTVRIDYYRQPPADAPKALPPLP